MGTAKLQYHTLRQQVLVWSGVNLHTILIRFRNKLRNSLTRPRHQDSTIMIEQANSARVESTRRHRRANSGSLAVTLALLPLVLLLTSGQLLPASAQQDQQQQQQQQTETTLASEYVNLNEILKHQQALTAECRRLEAQKLAELKQLIEFDRENDQVYLGNTVSLKLPAACLFLNGPPGGESQQQQQQQPPRLDLVNWLYDAEDLLPSPSGGLSNKTKRQTSSSSAAAVSSTNLPNSLLASNWLDLNLASGAAAAAADDENEIQDLSAEQLKERKFKTQVNKMIKSDEFKEALKLGQDKIEPYLSPVILVPGLAGSRLQARVSKASRVNIICKKEHDWKEMWLTLRSFLPLAIDCWLDNAKLVLDPESGFTRDPRGVESRVPDFGSVESVRHLDLKSPKLTKYFDEIIEHYAKLGYQADKNLFAAPYDFRLAPQQIGETFFLPLRKLIEHASNPSTGTSSSSGAAGGAGREKKVTLLCHSMGCTHLLIFLRQQSSAWRQAHVRKVIALSSPWGGSIKALKAIVVGEQFGIPLVSELKMRSLARSFPGIAYMLPQAEIFGAPSRDRATFNEQVLVQTPERNFKVDQLEDLLKAIGLEQHWEWFQQTTSLIRPLEPLPEVSLDCVHSLNVPTTETIIFRNSSDFPDGNYELVQGDGDGTVNHQSLLVCAQWAAKYPQRVRHRVIMNTSHTGILSHKSTLEHLTEDVVSINARQ